MSDNSRRKLIRNAALGGAILGTAELQRGWVKPVVESVTLPAHAATSPGSTSASATGASLNYFGKPAIVEHRTDQPLIGALVATAHAGQDEPVLFIDQVCIQVTGANTVSVTAVAPGLSLSAPSVVVGGEPTLMNSTPCSLQDTGIRDKGINPMDVLGVVPAAHAGLVSLGFEVQVDSLGASAQGTFFNTGLQDVLPFTIPSGTCSEQVCLPLEQ